MEISATQAKMADMDENEQWEAMLCRFPLLTPTKPVILYMVWYHMENLPPSQKIADGKKD